MKAQKKLEGFITIECPKCGEKTRSQVLAKAYLGGWCIGTGMGKHKPVNYRVVADAG